MSNTQQSDLTDAIIVSTVADIDGGKTDPSLEARDKADQILREKTFRQLEFQGGAERDAARKLYLTRCLVRSIYSLVLAVIAAGIFSTLNNPSTGPWIVLGWIALVMAFLRTSGLVLLPRNAAQRSRESQRF